MKTASNFKQLEFGRYTLTVRFNDKNLARWRIQPGNSYAEPVMTMTYSALITREQQLLKMPDGGVPQSFKNHRSALLRFLAFLRLTVENIIGPELDGDFDGACAQ